MGFFFKITIFLKISLVNNVFKLFRKLTSQVSYRLKFTITTRVLWTQVQHCPNFKKKKTKEHTKLQQTQRPEKKAKEHQQNHRLEKKMKPLLSLLEPSPPPLPLEPLPSWFDLHCLETIFVVWVWSSRFGFDLCCLGLIFVVWCSWSLCCFFFIVIFVGLIFVVHGFDLHGLWVVWVWSSWSLCCFYCFFFVGLMSLGNSKPLWLEYSFAST